MPKQEADNFISHERPHICFCFACTAQAAEWISCELEMWAARKLFANVDSQRPPGTVCASKTTATTKQITFAHPPQYARTHYHKRSDSTWETFYQFSRMFLWLVFFFVACHLMDLMRVFSFCIFFVRFSHWFPSPWSRSCAIGTKFPVNAQDRIIFWLVRFYFHRLMTSAKIAFVGNVAFAANVPTVLQLWLSVADGRVNRPPRVSWRWVSLF